MINQNKQENRIDVLLQMRYNRQVTIEYIVEVLYNEGV